MKTPSQEALIQRIEQVISDIRFDRIEGPVTFNDDEVHQLAETGEFYPISGTNHTVGGRAPADIGLAYTVKKRACGGRFAARSRFGLQRDSFRKDSGICRDSDHGILHRRHILISPTG